MLWRLTKWFDMITHVQVSSQIQPITSVISHVTKVILTGSPEAVEGIEPPVGGGELLGKETQLPLWEERKQFIRTDAIVTTCFTNAAFKGKVTHNILIFVNNGPCSKMRASEERGGGGGSMFPCSQEKFPCVPVFPKSISSSFVFLVP